MVKDLSLSTTAPASLLERFSISFEYDKTLTEVKRDVRVRTHKR